jgi:hypothetical protein
MKHALGTEEPFYEAQTSWAISQRVFQGLDPRKDHPVQFLRISGEDY